MDPVLELFRNFFTQHVIIEIIKLVLIALGLALVQRGWKYVQDRRGWLAGEWTQSIEEFEGRRARVDRVVCRHRHERVMASITREKPMQEKYKNWLFEGALREDGSLVGFFLGVEANSDSYGVIFLRKIDRDKFSGHYTRLLNHANANQEEASRSEIVRREQIPLTWTRVTRDGTAKKIGSHLKHWIFASRLRQLL